MNGVKFVEVTVGKVAVHVVWLYLGIEHLQDILKSQFHYHFT